VSAIQLVALMHLIGHDGARPSELASGLNLGAAAVTGLVDRMVAAGLVRRKDDPDDARAWRLHVTAAGRRAVDSARPVIAAANRALAARFTRDELEVVARFFRTVMELDESALTTEGAPDV
jgi:DNA-binding MarR family transcriptional regulator